MSEQIASFLKSDDDGYRFWRELLYRLNDHCLYDHCLVLFSWFKSFILVFICECLVENQCTIPSFARNRPLILFFVVQGTPWKQHQLTGYPGKICLYSLKFWYQLLYISYRPCSTYLDGRELWAVDAIRLLSHASLMICIFGFLLNYELLITFQENLLGFEIFLLVQKREEMTINCDLLWVGDDRMLSCSLGKVGNYALQGFRIMTVLKDQLIGFTLETGILHCGESCNFVCNRVIN